jgi:hypothetical protein
MKGVNLNNVRHETSGTLRDKKKEYCNEFAGSISQWKFITLSVQYTTLDYSSQLF